MQSDWQSVGCRSMRVAVPGAVAATAPSPRCAACLCSHGAALDQKIIPDSTCDAAVIHLNYVLTCDNASRAPQHSCIAGQQAALTVGSLLQRLDVRLAAGQPLGEGSRLLKHAAAAGRLHRRQLAPGLGPAPAALQACTEILAPLWREKWEKPLQVPGSIWPRIRPPDRHHRSGG